MAKAPPLAEDDKLSANDAVLAVALCAIAADGVIKEQERAALTHSLAGTRMFHEVKATQIETHLKRVARLAKAKGAGTLLKEAAGALPVELHATAFAIAADLMYADREVHEDERKILDRIRDTLMIPPDLAAQIVEVLEVKNRA